MFQNNRCLKHGLLNPNTTLSKEEENEYNLYNKTRESALESCHKQCELYKFDMRAASNEEVRFFLKKIKIKFIQNYFN